MLSYNVGYGEGREGADDHKNTVAEPTSCPSIGGGQRLWSHSQERVAIVHIPKDVDSIVYFMGGGLSLVAIRT